MKVLWIVNAPIPSAARALGMGASQTATWIEGAEQALVASGQTELTVACPYPGAARQRFGAPAYRTFSPVTRKHAGEAVGEFRQLLQIVEPDIVHIFGTEQPHCLPAVRACRELEIPHTIGLQGIISTIARHYNASVPIRTQLGFTVRDLVRLDNAVMQARKYSSWSSDERRSIEMSSHIIGRTTWDRAVAAEINPKAAYYCVPETLREPFYEGKWGIDHAEPGRIFFTQAHYPIKGFHVLLEALSLVIRRHPEAHVVVAGHQPATSLLHSQFRGTQYTRYLKQLAHSLELTDRIEFVGMQTAQEMKERYLSSHMYVSASSVENESNSLSEAMHLGVPSIASYVGGVIDRIRHGENGYFFQHDAPYMLAHYIQMILESPDTAARLGSSARASVQELHNPRLNTQKLLDAYSATQLHMHTTRTI